jgi:hypothetical protein
MKQGTKNILRVVISIVYILWGILSPITAFKAILALDIGAILSASVGIITLLAGIFGLMGVKKSKCRIFGIVIFILSIVSIVVALPAISINGIINAVLAWLFILCL